MDKLFIEDLPIKGKKVLMRVDFNVPLGENRNVIDAARIVAALDSIRYIIKNEASLILMSHLGRPRNAPNPDLSLSPVAEVLSNILEMPVKMAPDCIGSQVQQLVDNLKPKEILLLENLRFHRAEEHPEEDLDFAKRLAEYADFFVNDAFGTAHRKHCSTYFVPQHFPGKAAAGFLMEKEMRFLGEAIDHPKRPFYAILGGAKISSKIGTIKSLLKKVDLLFIGGAMAYTFLKALGKNVGSSFVEEEFLPLAKEIYDEKKILLPVDFLAAKECSEDSPTKLVEMQEGFSENYQGLDIGPKTIENFSEKLCNAKTIFWNGPLGVYEIDKFSHGTKILAEHIAKLNAVTIIGGGDLLAALKETHAIKKFSHVSTGGGATLEYIEKGTLPGIEVLSEKP